MTRVALFGGSFNPPHAAHQLVALYVLETQPVDELWFVPVYSHPFGKALAPYEHRVAMCELVAEALGPRCRVSRAEEELAQRPGFVASRTVDLVHHLAAPDRTLRLVVGADILGETGKWYRWSDVVAAAPLIAVGRSGHEVPAGSAVTGVAMPEVSATQVRELLAAGGPETPELTGLLPKRVLRYIATHHLYQP
ncbi:MAG: nicotinate-nicotinamide nucleotide adenylyltransferase [Deltaproteobacteria bacterium]|nr:nicotinate-nicotinamide nucleotide adenylyltransferase [Deltaproteobacteria bacterium]